MSLIGDGFEILGLIDKAKNADVYRQLGDYIEKIRALQLENDHLVDRLKEAERRLVFKGKIERIKGYAFVEGDDEEICPRCAEVDNRSVHLMVLRVPQAGARLCCPQCNLQTHRHVPVNRQQAKAMTEDM